MPELNPPSGSWCTVCQIWAPRLGQAGHMPGGSRESQSTRCVTLTLLVVFTKAEDPPQGGRALVVQMGLGL